MQVQLIKDCEGPNPKFDSSKKPGPDNPKSITVPKGTILTGGPEIILHCRSITLKDVTTDPNAVPYDDEAKAELEKYMESRKLKAKQREDAKELAERLAEE